MKQIIRRLAAAAFAVVVLCVSCIVPTFAERIDDYWSYFGGLDYLSALSWTFDPGDSLEYAEKIQNLIDEHCILSFSRSALTDVSWGTAEEGTYRRSLQASKVLFIMQTADVLQTGDRVQYISIPTFDMSWWDGQDDPHFRITGTGTPGIDIGASNTPTTFEIYIRQNYGEPYYRIYMRRMWNGVDGWKEVAFEAAFFGIYLMDFSSIQDLSFNRMFNLIGGFETATPKQGAIDYTAAYEQGYGVGRQEGYSAGWKEGEAEGEVIGYSDGYMTGFAEGDTKGYDRGKDEGFHQGQTDALNSTSTFKDMVFAIFDAPGRLIGSMLNFDLFGVNLLGLVKTLLTLTITAAIGFFVVKFWIAGKG